MKQLELFAMEVPSSSNLGGTVENHPQVDEVQYSSLENFFDRLFVAANPSRKYNIQNINIEVRPEEVSEGVTINYYLSATARYDNHKNFARYNQENVLRTHDTTDERFDKKSESISLAEELKYHLDDLANKRSCEKKFISEQNGNIISVKVNG